MHQRWTEHRYNIGTVKLELLATLRMDFTFEKSALHNFLWRTSLDRREVLENLFSTSFGEVKVVMVAIGHLLVFVLHNLFTKGDFAPKVD